MEPTLFDTSIYTVHERQTIADYGVDVDYDPYWDALEQDKETGYGLLEDKSVSSSNISATQELLEDIPSHDLSSSNGSTIPELLEENSNPDLSSSNSRRAKGDGSGCIYERTVIRSGKEYKQFYYQYEFWKKGNCLTKSSKYIPKRLLKQIEQMEAEKMPVSDILNVLGVIYW